MKSIEESFDDYFCAACTGILANTGWTLLPKTDADEMALDAARYATAMLKIRDDVLEKLEAK